MAPPIIREPTGRAGDPCSSGRPAVAPSHFYQLPQNQERKLRELYQRLDRGNSGVVDIKDLTRLLEEDMPHIPKGSALTIMRRADKNNSKTIDFAEFVHYVLEHEKRLAIVFKDLDKNQDGVVDIKEIKGYCSRLGVTISDADAERILRMMNSDGDATIDLAEFTNYLLFYPSADPLEIAKLWRHNMVIDIGEDQVLPEDFSSTELQSGAWWRHLLSGAAAGAVSRTCTAPLDRLKVYLQVHSHSQSNLTIRGAMAYMLKEGGVKSLWRGNGVNTIKIAPESAIKFMAYEQVKRYIKAFNNSEEITMCQRLFAGSMAGCISQTTIYPLEVLKTRLALRKTGTLNRGLFRAAVALYRAEGLKTFYRGYIPNVIGIIPYAGIDLAVYETLKAFFTSRSASPNEPGVASLLAAGTISSTCGMAASYPLALVRTRLQAARVKVYKFDREVPRTMLGQFKQILSTDGPTGLYRGIAPNCLKVIPAVSISYVVYETVRKHLGIEMT